MSEPVLRPIPEILAACDASDKAREGATPLVDTGHSQRCGCEHCGKVWRHAADVPYHASVCVWLLGEASEDRRALVAALTEAEEHLRSLVLEHDATHPRVPGDERTNAGHARAYLTRRGLL